jgi:hypothetical protein
MAARKKTRFERLQGHSAGWVSKRKMVRDGTQVLVRLTPSESIALGMFADQAGVTKSNYLRKFIQKKAMTELPAEFLETFVQESL